MAWKIDPNNLSASDVWRIVAPTIAVIVVLVLVGRYAADFAWLLIALLAFGVPIAILRLPKRESEAIVERERDLAERISRIPKLGPIAKPMWRWFNWLGAILGAAMLILIVTAAILSVL